MNQILTYVKTGFLLFCLVMTGQLSAQISNNSVSSTQIICKTATPSLFQGTVPTGGSGNYTYQWQLSILSDTLGFIDIVSATDTNYQSISLGTTTWFRRIVMDGTLADTSIAVEVTVSPNPIAGFEINNDKQCLNGNILILKDSSTISSGIYKVLWDFGDGATDTLNNTSHNYSSDGNFNASLVVTSDQGCKDSLSHAIVIYPNPEVYIPSIANATQCLNGNQFDLIDSSSIASGAYTREWSFGDGATDSSFSASHTYITAGNYTIKLTLTSDNNCMSEDSVLITVNPSPVAKAIVDSTTQCFKGNNLIFNDSSSITSGSYSILWNFGDGATDTLYSTSHTYSAAGIYNASMIVTSDKGCIDSTSGIVTINPEPVVYIPSIANATQCLNGNQFDLIDSSSIASGAYTREWSFGDGATDTSFSASHTYITAGNYTIKLTLISNSNCISEDSVLITVNPSPMAKAIVDSATQCFKGNNLIFNDSSSITSGSYSILWNFGDGATDTLNSTSHIYSAAGIYNASMIVTSDKGCIDSTSGIVTINPEAVVYIPSIANATQCLNGNQFDLIDSSSIASGAYTRKWSFGDGATDTSFSASHTYITAGNYTIKLTLTSNSNCISEDSVLITVNPSPMAKADVNADKQCYKGNNFVVTDSSSISSGSYTLLWDFGDTYTDTLLVAQHTYASEGSYHASLVVTSDKGCIDSISGTLLVHPSPIANISYIANTEQCLNGNVYNYFDSSTISMGSYTRFWDFGDGSNDTISTVMYQYNTHGFFDLTLYITSDSGCTDTSMVKLTVNPSPKAKAAVNNAIQCFNGNDFVVSDSSSIASGVYSLIWDFGDNTYDTSSMASHSYTSSGDFQVSLIVTSDKGCNDTLSGKFTVNESPSAAMNLILNTTQCYKDNSFNFGDSSIIASGTYTRLWNFGDGNTDTAANVNNYTYSSDGTYEVKLYITSDLGCIDSTSIKLTINPSPNVNVGINSDTQCEKGNSFVITDSTTISSGSYTRLWDFGDGYTDTSAIATHTYSAVGNYHGSLIITSDKGCIDSIGGTLTVNASPYTRLVITGGAQCLSGNNFIYYDSSIISSGSYNVLWNFGDGNTDTLYNTNHSYSAYGKFYTYLITTSDLGCKDSLMDSVEVYPHPKANASLNNSTQCFNGNSFTAYDSTTIANGTYTRMWGFGDGYTDTNAVATHSYAASGAYTGYLIVKSDMGCTDSIGTQITVNESPVSKLVVSSNAICFNGHSIDFYDSSSFSTGNLSRIIYFGDNDSSLTAPVNHIYAAVGNYTSSLIAIASNGCTDTTKLTIDINENPKANFTVNKGSQCFSVNSFDLTNSSSLSSGIITYIWNFGDANSDTATNPSHSYTTDGAYTIQLIAVSSLGCTDTAKAGVNVYPSPVAKWNVNKATQCFVGNSFSFSDSTIITSGSVKLNWDFDNGITDSISQPTIVYTATGTYMVVLKATSDSGCTSIYSAQVVVNQNPKATNNASGATIICSGKTVDLKTISGTGLIYQWLKNGIVVSGAIDSIYNANASGLYRALVTNSSGCSDTSAAVSVTVNPKSNFGAITGLTAVTSNSTQTYSVTNVTGVTYNWTVNGGTILLGQGTNSIQVKWSMVGTGKVLLKGDCYNDDSITVNIVNGIGEINNPIADIYPNPTQGNINIILPSAGYEYIQLFDVSGKLVITKGINGQNQLSLDMSELAAGIYQVVISGSSGNIHQKVILTK